jgi:hypothetical protein
MGFLNIAIILRILLGFFQVFYAIFRDFFWILGFWDLVRFWDFSKDFFGFLMKCTKIFRVIYPSDSATQTDFEVHNNVGVNIADVTNAADNQCTYTLSGLSTEIEGLKLNIIITESNILSKVQSNVTIKRLSKFVTT